MPPLRPYGWGWSEWGVSFQRPGKVSQNGVFHHVAPILIAPGLQSTCSTKRSTPAPPPVPSVIYSLMIPAREVCPPPPHGALFARRHLPFVSFPHLTVPIHQNVAEGPLPHTPQTRPHGREELVASRKRKLQTEKRAAHYGGRIKRSELLLSGESFRSVQVKKK